MIDGDVAVAVARKHPATPIVGKQHPLAKTLQAQVASGATKDAFSSIKRLLAVAPKKASIAKAVSDLASSMPRAEFLARSGEVVADVPGAWPLRLWRALLLINGGPLDSAWTEIEAMVRIKPGVMFPPVLQKKIVSHVVAYPEDRARLESLLREYPESGPLFWMQVLAMNSVFEPEAARDLVRANWNWAKHSLPAAAFFALDFVDAASAPGIDDPVSPARKQLLITAGRLEEALACTPDGLDHALLRQAVALGTPRYPPMQPSADGQEMTVSGHERRGGTVVVFTGIQDRAWVPTHVLDRFFAALGLKAVFLSDYSRLGFLAGLKTYGGFQATVDALQAEVGVVPGTPVYTMGASAGGVAAVVYAEALNASATLLFSPPSSFNRSVEEATGDKRGRAWVRRLRQHVDVEAIDLGRILGRMPENYRLTVYAGAGSGMDRLHAERFATMAGTSVHLVEGDHHNSLALAAARIGLIEVLSRAFGVVAKTGPHGFGDQGI